jgi:hypothetical protein
VVVRLLVLLPEILEELMLEDLRCCVAFVRVVNKHLQNDVLGVCGHVGNQLLDTHKLLGLKVKLHVGRMLLEVIEQLLPWRSHDVVNLVDLIKLIVPGEKREQGEHLKENTARTPDVHLVPIVTVCEQALGRSVPTC